MIQDPTQSGAAGPSRGAIAEDVLRGLIHAGTDAWREFSRRSEGRFHLFIPADAFEAHACLVELKGRAHSFLELGSGAGLITILADLLGFEAYGIEIEPELVRISRDLARDWGSDATFVEGSFVPPEYRDEIALLDGDFLTVTDGADPYEELGLDLADFDVIYSYPWPGEEEWLIELVRRHARPNTILVRYSGTEGFELDRFS